MPDVLQWLPTDPSGACVKLNSAGIPYEDLACLYPVMGKTYLPFESNYNIVPVREWMVSNPWVPLLAVLLYGVGIVYGQRYFAERKPWNLRQAMALWNLGLSVFSFWGLSRTLPKFLFNLANYSWIENLCLDPESHVGAGPEGVWTQFFILSKFPELIDTFFIVVHKKPLIFLHWYHHITVLLFCWQAYTVKSAVGPFFIVMNYAVHAIMYFYYFLMAVKSKPKWFNPEWITIAQISQMIVGVFITANTWYLILAGSKPEGCSLTAGNQVAGLVMYGSYLYLFCEFFFKRYAIKSSSQKKKSALAKQQ